MFDISSHDMYGEIKNYYVIYIYVKLTFTAMLGNLYIF